MKGEGRERAGSLVVSISRTSACRVRSCSCHVRSCETCLHTQQRRCSRCHRPFRVLLYLSYLKTYSREPRPFGGRRDRPCCLGDFWPAWSDLDRDGECRRYDVSVYRNSRCSSWLSWASPNHFISPSEARFVYRK